VTTMAAAGEFDVVGISPLCDTRHFKRRRAVPTRLPP
jgi:hypothetical protein